MGLSGVLSQAIESNLISACLATAVPLLFVAFMLKDSKSRMILLFYCYGVFSSIVCFVFSNSVSAMSGQEGRVNTVIAPIIEEIIKAAPIIVYWLKKKNSRELILIEAALSCGIGFSIAESLYYLFNIYGNGASSLFLISMRTLTSCLMHGMTTAVLGFGLYLGGRNGVKTALVFGLLSLAIIIHSLFNLLMDSSLSAISALMPLVLYFMGAAILRSGDAKDGC